MTREEAKNVLRLYNNQKFGIVSPEFWEAIAVAIAALQSDPDAPDWSQAPEWATHYHKDSSGHEWWYEYEPKKTSYKGFLPTIGRVKLAKAAHPIEKLFKRPDL